uniref:Uncharacterized protein n=1 Tax=Rhodopseudomonas palustris (strain BisA53) TaxID=316055 RepID=Q07M09_RHOP5
MRSPIPSEGGASALSFADSRSDASILSAIIHHLSGGRDRRLSREGCPASSELRLGRGRRLGRRRFGKIVRRRAVRRVRQMAQAQRKSVVQKPASE